MKRFQPVYLPFWKNMDSSTAAVKKTLAYSDIFDYPLTFEQLYQFLIAKKQYTKSIIRQTLASSPDIIQRGRFYAYASREKLIGCRKQKKKYNEAKIEKAQYIAKKLSHIPTVLFIGISGGVAMKNAAKHDDIDLFVITKKRTVWMSRLLLLLSLSLYGVLRTRRTKQFSDTMCLNMLIDETALSFPKERQDLYTAHEIVQMIPLLERGHIYTKFLHANKWIAQYMPHSLQTKKRHIVETTSIFSRFLSSVISHSFVELLAKKLQKQYMGAHITTETISASFLAFHPSDYRKKTLSLYNRRVKKYV